MDDARITNSYGVFEAYLARRRAAVADRLIPSALREGRLLDIGCGWTPLFLLQTVFREKVGVDAEVKRWGVSSGITLLTLDVEEAGTLPFPDGHFDVVTMLAVFEHIRSEKLPGVLREIRRVLTARGRLILTTPCPWTDPVLRVLACAQLVSPEGVHEHQATYTPRIIIRHLQAAGFDPSKIRFGYFEAGFNTWLYADR